MRVPEATPFALLGGADRVRALVERFYDLMSEREPALARLHPCTPDGKVERGPRDRFGLFLIGWLGGPQDYIATHGHPRLRMRHNPFVIGPDERDHWLAAMRASLAELAPSDEVAKAMNDYFDMAAEAMRNAD